MDIKQVGKVIMTVKEFVDSNKDKTTYWIGCGSHFDIFPSYCKDELIEKLGKYEIDNDSICKYGFLTKFNIK